MESSLQQLQYPMGRFESPEKLDLEEVNAYISEIEKLPIQLREAVSGLSEEQLDTPYRDGGWTVRQVVHHIADSHINSYIRFRWTLTEDRPTIKAYHEALWAELDDARTAPVDLSLNLIDSLHARWVRSLRSLSREELELIFIHPENQNEVSLYENIASYAWHCRHHLAHITELRKRKCW